MISIRYFTLCLYSIILIEKFTLGSYTFFPFKDDPHIKQIPDIVISGEKNHIHLLGSYNNLNMFLISCFYSIDTFVISILKKMVIIYKNMVLIKNLNFAVLSSSKGKSFFP